MGRLGPARAIARALALGCGLTISSALIGFTPPALAAGTTWYVSASATGDPACGAASQSNPFHTIAGALGCAGNGDSVSIGKGTFPGAFTVGADVTITGANGATVIDDPGAAFGTPIVTIGPGVAPTIQDLTIDGKNAQAGVRASSGALSIVKATIRNAITLGNGGGIDVEVSSGHASVSVLGSTFVNDAAEGTESAGGAIALVDTSDTAQQSSLTLTNSTLNANHAVSPAGGGIYVTNTNAQITDSTFADNTAITIYAANSNGTVALGNDIISSELGASAGNAVCASQEPVVDEGHNVFAQPGTTNCGAIADGVRGDQVGTATSPLNADLGALASHGGPTQTMAPLAGSPAIAAGSPALCAAAPAQGLDQRGDKRNITSRGGCDVGAYDTGKFLNVLYVSATATADPPCAAASKTNPFRTLSGALACAGSGDEISIGSGTFLGGVTVNGNVTLAGAGAGTVIDDPSTADGTLNVTIAADRWVTLKTLTIDGKLHQAGISASTGALNVTKTTIQNTITAHNGAAIDVQPASGQTAVTVFDSTLTNNQSNGAGAIAVTAADAQAPSSLSVTNSTLSGNISGAEGAAIWITNVNAMVAEDTINGNVGTPDFGVSASGALTTLTLGNDIISGPISPDLPACNSEGPVVDLGHNLLAQPGVGRCSSIVAGTNGDQVGTTTNPLNPDLGKLASNGGPTKTMALLTGSPAIGGGSATQCEAPPISGLDQRGKSRNAVTRGVCDIGAYDTGA